MRSKKQREERHRAEQTWLATLSESDTRHYRAVKEETNGLLLKQLKERVKERIADEQALKERKEQEVRAAIRAQLERDEKEKRRLAGPPCVECGKPCLHRIVVSDVPVFVCEPDRNGEINEGADHECVSEASQRVRDAVDDMYHCPDESVSHIYDAKECHDSCCHGHPAFRIFPSNDGQWALVRRDNEAKQTTLYVYHIAPRTSEKRKRKVTCVDSLHVNSTCNLVLSSDSSSATQFAWAGRSCLDTFTAKQRHSCPCVDFISSPPLRTLASIVPSWHRLSLEEEKACRLEDDRFFAAARLIRAEFSQEERVHVDYLQWANSPDGAYTFARTVARNYHQRDARDESRGDGFCMVSSDRRILVCLRIHSQIDVGWKGDEPRTFSWHWSREVPETYTIMNSVPPLVALLGAFFGTLQTGPIGIVCEYAAWDSVFMEDAEYTDDDEQEEEGDEDDDEGDEDDEE